MLNMTALTCVVKPIRVDAKSENASVSQNEVKGQLGEN